MTPQRAPALPAEERRAMIVTATRRLLAEHGPQVTTKQIAEAAGIAEGTIFRVFCDKPALIDAAVEAAFDPAPLEDAIAAIDPDLPCQAQVALAVDVLQRRHAEIWHLMSRIGTHGPDQHRSLADIAALAELLGRSGLPLTCEPVVAARILRALTLAASPPLMAGDSVMTPAEIVALFLDGVRGGASREATPC